MIIFSTKIECHKVWNVPVIQKNWPSEESCQETTKKHNATPRHQAPQRERHLLALPFGFSQAWPHSWAKHFNVWKHGYNLQLTSKLDSNGPQTCWFYEFYPEDSRKMFKHVQRSHTCIIQDRITGLVSGKHLQEAKVVTPTLRFPVNYLQPSLGNDCTLQ
jgi:hypothetical protein